MYQLTSSAAMVGAVSVAQFLPQLVLTPWSGARADRGGRRGQLVTGRLIAAVGSAALMVWILLPGLQGTGGAVALLAASLLVGVGFALGGPALHALVPSLVRPSELATAVALNSMPYTVGRAAGPALGAALLTTGGPGLTFGVAAASNITFAAILILLPIRDRTGARTADTRIRAALRHVRMNASIARILVGSTAAGIGADPVITLTPSIAQDLGSGPPLVGALASAFGAGALVIFAALGLIRRRLGLGRMAVAGLVVMAAGLAGLAASQVPVAAIASLGLAGTGMTLAVTALTTLLQERSPDSLRGRLMAMWSVAFLGSRPLAAAMNGAVADLASPGVALALVVLILLAAAYCTRSSRLQS